MIQINYINYDYADFTLSVSETLFRRGELIALVGQNGCGKTTFLNSLSGLIKANSSISVGGVEHANLRESSLRHVHLNAFAPLSNALTVSQHALMFSQLYKSEASDSIESIAESLGISPLLSRRPSSLSAGQLTLVRFFLVMLVTPDVLTLDEPTTAIDIANINLVLGFIERFRKDGTLVIFSSHHLHDLAVLKPRLFGLKGGSVVFDQNWDKTFEESDNLRKMMTQLIECKAA